RAKKEKSTTIYLTATPRQNLRLRIALKIRPYTFVPVRYHGNPLPVPTLKICYALKKSLRQQKIPKTLLDWITNRKNRQRQLLIFVPSIHLAKEVQLNLQKSHRIQLGDIVSVHSEDEQRVEKIEQFRNKKIDVLVTTTILERGVTFPSVDVVVLDSGHDVFDEAALVQIARRAGRSADDPTGEVIFLHDGKTDAMVQAVHSIK